jgi:hypothetical protein
MCHSYIHVKAVLNSLQEFDLPADRPYLFGYHPHGMLMSSSAFNLSLDAFSILGIISM